MWKIIHSQPHISNVSARWVPRLLIHFQIQRDLSMQLLTLLEKDEEDLFGRLLSLNKCRIYLYDPEREKKTNAQKLETHRFGSLKKTKIKRILRRSRLCFFRTAVQSLSQTTFRWVGQSLAYNAEIFRARCEML